MGALAVRWRDHARKDAQATDQARSTNIRPNGHTEQFGELTAAKPHPDVAVRLKGALTSLKLSLHPDLYFGELYADGALIIERGTLWDLLELLGRNQLERSVPGNSVIRPLQAFLSWMRQGDSRRAAGRHVAHHYDLPHEHYRRFLDADLQYSCAYFADPSFSLEQAQEAKKRYISQACIRAGSAGARHWLRVGHLVHLPTNVRLAKEESATAIRTRIRSPKACTAHSERLWRKAFQRPIIASWSMGRSHNNATPGW